MRRKSNRRSRLCGRLASICANTAGSASNGVIMFTPLRSSAPQNATHGTAHNRATDRAACLAAKRFADIGGDTVSDRARNFSGHGLGGREPLAARPVGTEDDGERIHETIPRSSKPTRCGGLRRRVGRGLRLGGGGLGGGRRGRLK